MALLSLSRMGHPVLRQPAQEILAEELLNEDHQRLIDDMVETMHDAEGVGLAATQVYRDMRLIIAEVRAPKGDASDEGTAPLTVLANPRIVRASEEIDYGWEGCLSIPDIRGIVPRHRAIIVKALDRRARPMTLEATGFFARVLQHEIDHLNGILFLDRMEDMRSLTFLKEFERHWSQHDEEDEEVE
jgi:peptide deformylase